MVKFLDLKSQYYSIKSEIDKAIQNVIENSAFIGGEHVAQFETNFSNYVGTDYCIGVGNGTDALEISIEALDMPIGSEIIVPANSFIASSEAVTRSGHKVVFVDIDTESYVISIEDLKKRITPKTKAIMAVHLYGHPCDMDELAKIAKEYNLYIIEDCAQAHGAEYKGKRVGGIGDIATFSFYPGKNLGAYGDAGIITTNNKKFYNMIKSLRNLGSTKKFIHDHIGVNSRLDTVQAIILNKKLKYLKKLNLKRRKIANLYNKNILNNKITKLIYSKSCVYHQYVILVDERNKFIKYLQKSKIQYGFHYPFAIHQLKVFKNYFNGEKFPNAEILSKNGISIPIDPNLTKKEISFIINKLNNFK